MSDAPIPAPGEEGYDAGDPNHVKRARNDARRREKDDAAVVAALMENGQGRAWLWGLLGFCGIYQSPFSLNEMQMAYAAGKGDVGRKLLADIVQHAPDQYVMMIKEHQRK